MASDNRLSVARAQPLRIRPSSRWHVERCTNEAVLPFDGIPQPLPSCRPNALVDGKPYWAGSEVVPIRLRSTKRAYRLLCERLRAAVVPPTAAARFLKLVRS